LGGFGVLHGADDMIRAAEAIVSVAPDIPMTSMWSEIVGDITIRHIHELTAGEQLELLVVSRARKGRIDGFEFFPLEDIAAARARARVLATACPATVAVRISRLDTAAHRHQRKRCGSEDVWAAKDSNPETFPSRSRQRRRPISRR
jgi:hypothetical protein